MSEPEKSPEDMSVDELKKLVAKLNTNFKLAMWGGGVLMTILSGLGYSKLTDIDAKAKERVDGVVAKSTEYLDLVINGQTRIQGYQWAAAIPYFEKARTERPDDEFILFNLLQCYANAAEIDAGLRLVEDVEKNGLFTRQFNQVWTMLNAGRLYTMASIDKPELTAKAEYYLGRASRASEVQKGDDLSYVLYAKAIFEYTRGNPKKWMDYLKNLVEQDPRAKDWPNSDRSDPWFQLLLRKYPKLYDDFDKAVRG